MTLGSSIMARAWSWVAIALLSLWLRTGFPVHAVPDSGIDDLLFMRLAAYLGHGAWLGPYDDVTLVKGMFYPLFILVAFAAAVPLKIAEHLVYLGASAYTARLTIRMTASRRFGLLLFALLAFNPMLWTVELARVIREGLYISLSLALVALLIDAALPM